MSLVLDASMTIAWIFAAERKEGTRTVLRRVARGGAAVPSLWRLEVANILRNSVRGGRCSVDYADRSIARLQSLPISIDRETDRQAWGETRRLALAQDLTVYDAAYLELAIRRGWPLASLDKALNAAARRTGVSVLDGNG